MRLAPGLAVLAAAIAGCGHSGGTPKQVTPDQILAATAQCTPVPGANLYATDSGVTPTVQVCELPGAYFWHSDMDIDCDGGSSTICTSDPAYQASTSATDSGGRPLDASTLPYVVVPLPGNGFDYAAAGIHLGAAALVVYGGNLAYGVFGDEGPSTIIGEGSYAMAQSLGIDPDPVTGGVDSGVTFVVFSGTAAVVSPIESHDAAVRLGTTLARTLVP